MNKKGKGFYYGMVESFQRYMYLNYLVWRIDRIRATPVSESFTLDEKKKLIGDALKELKELSKEKK